MKMYKRYQVRPVDLPKFMKDHVDECIVFRIMKQDLMCLDIVQEMSKAEYNMLVLNNMLKHIDDVLNEDEKVAIEYAIECIKTLDDMGIIKESNDD